MRKTWTQIKNETMTKKEQRQAHMLALRDLMEMELAELRETLQVSQEELVKKLKVTQTAISRLEHRPNVLLESISNYIQALGGRLELHAVLGNKTVRLTPAGFHSEKDRSEKTSSRRSTRSLTSTPLSIL